MHSMYGFEVLSGPLMISSLVHDVVIHFAHFPIVDSVVRNSMGQNNALPLFGNRQDSL